MVKSIQYALSYVKKTELWIEKDIVQKYSTMLLEDITQMWNGDEFYFVS